MHGGVLNVLPTGMDEEEEGEEGGEEEGEVEGDGEEEGEGSEDETAREQ